MGEEERVLQFVAASGIAKYEDGGRYPWRKQGTFFTHAEAIILVVF